ncbi:MULTISPECIES: helix-turn-helix domain-containing protein [Bacillus]|uniref:helix-turn-helix domain-containing protein n=1 Tax=Bacillus TaxID=1386 RepID=UPI0027DCF8FD|nr:MULTISPECIES: helix-turn-helix transcriptional regulator [Bacillus]
MGLEKLAKTFGLSVNQIAKELGIGRQTVYDWLKEKRRIPKDRLDQLSKIPEFSHVNMDLFQKEIDRADELEIELAYFQHLSAKHSEEIVDEDGIPFILDPYYQDRVALEAVKQKEGELKQKEEELKRTRLLLQDDTNLFNAFHRSTDEIYLLALSALNGTFQQDSADKIKAVTNLLVLINMNNMTNELNKELEELIKKHDIFGGAIG